MTVAAGSSDSVVAWLIQNPNEIRVKVEITPSGGETYIVNPKTAEGGELRIPASASIVLRAYKAPASAASYVYVWTA